ncbi:MAG TPA: hypothetical protein VMF07_01765 [Solirubrobacteraceae bacterium]|nr:hypothetical protein [Solirubrobacteraceae bacterium]
MTPLLRRRWALVASVVLVLVTGGVALAASAPLPLRNKVYNRAATAGSKQLGLTLIVSRTRATRLVAGPLSPPLGSQYALSTGALPCPSATHNPGLAKGETPFALFGFPGATLRLRDGKYQFSVKRTKTGQAILGSPAKPFRLTVRLTGTVINPRTIEGTLSAVGGPCTTRKPLQWKVTLNRKLKPPPMT